MVGVRVSYNSPGGEEVLEADHVHVAVPAAVVDNIKFEPGLIADHKQAFDSTVTTKVHRVRFRCGATLERFKSKNLNAGGR